MVVIRSQSFGGETDVDPCPNTYAAISSLRSRVSGGVRLWMI